MLWRYLLILRHGISINNVLCQCNPDVANVVKLKSLCILLSLLADSLWDFPSCVLRWFGWSNLGPNECLLLRTCPLLNASYLVSVVFHVIFDFIPWRATNAVKWTAAAVAPRVLDTSLTSAGLVTSAQLVYVLPSDYMNDFKHFYRAKICEVRLRQVLTCILFLFKDACVAKDSDWYKCELHLDGCCFRWTHRPLSSQLNT